jgi:L-alanine-DL-glutamate epimerase-like enolase superfamily enzyme
MTCLETVVVTVSDGEFAGRGEATGVDYLNETVASMTKQLEAIRPILQREVCRERLQGLLPVGGARNALDCALWELEAKRAGQPVWRIAGLSELKPLLTTVTIGADDPAAMAGLASSYPAARAIKLKLTGEPEDAERVLAVRAARPEVWLGVDGNQGFERAHFHKLLPRLIEAGVELIEQPFPIGHEPLLKELESPIRVAADESAQGLSDLRGLVDRFDMVNIKLDKCGGLTEALAICQVAHGIGLDLMVGNMVGTSLAMAPAFIVGQLCEVVDLDGPLLLERDRLPGVRYEEGLIHCQECVWGSSGTRSAGSLSRSQK